MAKKAATTVTTTGKYWLLKTEPGEWSWSDQAGAPGGVAPWDGVRNRQAVNNLRAMRPGERCLFYHSGAGAASRRVVGVVEVSREWYEGEEAAAGGAVDVRAVGEFRQPVALGEIKKAAGEVEGMRDFMTVGDAHSGKGLRLDLGEEEAASGVVNIRAVREFRKLMVLGEIKKATGEVKGMRDLCCSSNCDYW